MNQDASKTLSDHSDNGDDNDDCHACKCISRRRSVKKNAPDVADNKSDSVSSAKVCVDLRTSLDHLTGAILELKAWTESKRAMKAEIKELEKKNALYVTLMRADEQKISDLRKAQGYLTIVKELIQHDDNSSSSEASKRE